jgi:hypothetical protein
MRALSWMTCLWPGLAALWLRGRGTGLLGAVAFAGALNFALIATFAPEGWAASSLWLRGAAWVLVLGFWILGIRRGLSELSRPRQAATPARPQLDEWFRQAQTEYLRGHWIEAETLLARLLVQQPDDAEARLLLASIQRRTGRLAASRKTLTEMSSDETATRWIWEIQAELARIRASEKEQPESSGESLSRAA